MLRLISIWMIFHLGSLAIADCGISGLKTKADAPQQTQWILTSHRPKAVALVVTGLNVRWQALQDFVGVLSDEKIDQLVWILPGLSGQSLDEQKNITTQVVMKSIQSAFVHLKERATCLDVPIVLLGYSYGGLAAVATEAQFADVDFSAKILIAPPLKVHFYVPWVKLGFAFFDFIPSWGVPGYQLYSYTGVDLYQTLFEMKDLLIDLAPHIRQKINDPTLLIIDSRDELVSFKEIKSWQSRHELGQWQNFEFDNSQARLNKYHHLIVDKQTVPEAIWHDIIKKIGSHFESL